MIPVIIQGRSDPKCPQCGRDESIERRCRHCHYVYPRAISDGAVLALALLATVALIWALLTFLSWAFPAYPQKTLVTVLRDQVEFVTDLLHRIW